MKKFGALLLACLMMFSVFSVYASANDDYGIMPCWNNTNEVVIVHGAVGTTACCQIDINVAWDATIENVDIRLIDMTAGRVVKRWINPTMTVDVVNTHSFYDEVPNVTLGHDYQLYISCEVWLNGVCDYINSSWTASY